MKTTYIVSGYMRSGTSMMMKALEAGGLTPAFSKSRNNMNRRYGDNDYKPNAGGFYELTREDYAKPDFPAAYEGMLIKCLYGGIPKIKAGDYKIVYMLRDFEEIRQSFEAFFGGHNSLTPEAYHTTMETTIGILEMRKDVDLTVLNYRDVVNNPIEELSKLTHWGIDVNKAATIVDPELCRFRLEELEVGI